MSDARIKTGLWKSHRSVDGRWVSDGCPVCDGTGQFLAWAPGNTTMTAPFMCDCDEQLVLRRWMQVRGISGSMRGLRWVDLSGVAPSVRAWTNGYLKSVRQNTTVGLGAYFYGETGSGKSAVATLLVKHCLELGIDSAVIDGPNVMAEIQNWNDRERMDRWTARVFTVPVLLFDELGRETGHPDAVRSQVERIIQQRLSDRLTTFITSNLSPDQMRTKFGPYAVDAVAGRGNLVDCTISESWRPKEVERDRQEVSLGIRRPAVFG